MPVLVTHIASGVAGSSGHNLGGVPPNPPKHRTSAVFAGVTDIVRTPVDAGITAFIGLNRPRPPGSASPISQPLRGFAKWLGSRIQPPPSRKGSAEPRPLTRPGLRPSFSRFGWLYVEHDCNSSIYSGFMNARRSARIAPRNVSGGEMPVRGIRAPSSGSLRE